MTELTNENFEAEVLGSEMPVFVDFWAEWCPPCKMQGPIFEKLESRYAGKIKFAKLNVDTAPVPAVTLRVMNIPTLIYFANGEAEEKLVGLRQEDELIEFLDGKTRA